MKLVFMKVDFDETFFSMKVVLMKVFFTLRGLHKSILGRAKVSRPALDE